LLKVIKDRPDIITNSKEFFSLISYPKLSMYVEKEGVVENIDCYNKVVNSIKEDLATLSKTKDDKSSEKAIEAFREKWINALRGKILAGKNDKNTITNKVSFYTQYHVMHFIEKLADAILVEAHPVNKAGEPVATASDPVATASTEQVTVPEKKPPVHICKSLDEALLLGIQSGGLWEDALLHPFCIGLKGTEVQDPSGPNKITLNEENYPKYIQQKYAEVYAVWKSKQTTYPMEEMISLIQKAIESNQSAEDFVKENISLIKKTDKDFLKLTGTIGDVESSVNIKTEEDFLNWVKEIYALEQKLDGPKEDQIVYSVSIIKDFKDFEEQIKSNVTDKKMSLKDVQKWAREAVVDKTFANETGKDPVFTSEKVVNLDTYLEILTRKLYETPETVTANLNKVKEHAITLLKAAGDKAGLHGIVGEVRAFCTKNSIDCNLKDLRALVLEESLVHNKPVHDKYMANRGALEKEGLVTKLPEKKTEVKSEDKKKIIVESADKSQETNELVKAMLDEAKKSNISTQQELIEILDKYRDNPAAILRVALCLISTETTKRIKDMKMTDAEVNTWVTSFLAVASVAPESLENTAVGHQENNTNTTSEDAENATEAVDTVKANPVKSETSKTTEDDDDPEFVELENAADKKKFREALDKIVKNFEDSTELRGDIIEAIQNGKGAHTRIVAKSPIAEMHKMIKKAFERVEDNIIKENLD